MKLVPESKAVITTSQAGRLLGASRATVIEMCKRGELRGAYRVGVQWRIPVEAVEKVRNPVQPARREPTP